MDKLLTRILQYGVVKRLEHLWKGLSHDSSQISPVPPEAYGERFIKFMTGITMTREEAERQAAEEGHHLRSETEAALRAQHRGITTQSLDGPRSSRDLAEPAPQSPGVDRTMQKAHKQADKDERGRSTKEEPADRTLGTVRSPSAERTPGATLPVVEEVGEAGSTGGRSGRSGNSTHQINERNGDYPESRKPGVRHVSPEEDTDGGELDRFPSFMPDGPELAPPLSASPPPMDPEKSIAGMMDRRPSPEGRHTR